MAFSGVVEISADDMEDDPGFGPAPPWPLMASTFTSTDDDPADIFQLLVQLGRGSYGSVYKARVRETGELVAIKIIPLGDASEMEEVQREITMLQECNHPNVVRYLGSWRRQEGLWIAMEYCGGGSVADLMQAADAPLEEEVIAWLCCETLAGLAYLHSMGKVHRDIKCGNILVTETGEVKVADFGVAAQLTHTMSKRNTFVGTPHWMAPEVIQESRYDGKVDVWALGISAVEMAEGSPPRWTVHPMRVIFMISREPPPQLADRDRWSLPFHDFVAQCLQKDPKVRPTARWLQQHKFAARASPSAAGALLPLITASRDRLANRLSTLQPPSSALGEALSGATGRFSWRATNQLGSTVPFGDGLAGTTHLLGAWPPPPAQGDESGTFVVHADLDAVSAGTVVIHEDEEADGNYLAALRAAGADSDGYMEAVRAAKRVGPGARTSAGISGKQCGLA
eukprot:jgi/Botrbrau1/1861/Bobra.146_1s0049.2